jgi:NAD(P)-dependent dehydrogenase (short-subunit alcohol dehydrogenase family)
MMQSDIFDLTGQVAVVTGSTRGIGRSIAQCLAGAGASVVIVGRKAAECERTAAEMSAAGLAAISLPTDVTRLAEVEELMCKIEEKFGRIDILVNNAGSALTHKAEDITEEQWNQVLDIDLKSVFFCSQRAGRRMIRQQAGRIINTASIMGMVGQKLTLSYCAAKAGVIGLTRALAIEWAEHNIRVNAICPGYVLTSINEEAMKNEKIYNATLRKIPLGRLGQVSDMAGAVLFLASDASAYMTGQTLTVDGGWTAQ